MQGYRTLVIAAIGFLAPAAARWGFKIDPAIIADSLMVILPAAMAIMRAVTKTPIGAKS